MIDMKIADVFQEHQKKEQDEIAKKRESEMKKITEQV